MTERFGIGLLFDEYTFNTIRNLELNLKRNFNLIDGLKQPPHITIKAPFEFNDFEKLEIYFDELSNSLTQFDVDLTKVDSFGINTIFLDVGKNEKLLDLHLRILKDFNTNFNLLPSQFEGKNVKFHSTVALHNNDVKIFEESFKYLNSIFQRIPAKIEGIGLFKHLGEEIGWVIINKKELI